MGKKLGRVREREENPTSLAMPTSYETKIIFLCRANKASKHNGKTASDDVEWQKEQKRNDERKLFMIPLLKLQKKGNNKKFLISDRKGI